MCRIADVGIVWVIGIEQGISNTRHRHAISLAYHNQMCELLYDTCNTILIRNLSTCRAFDINWRLTYTPIYYENNEKLSLHPYRSEASEIHCLQSLVAGVGFTRTYTCFPPSLLNYYYLIITPLTNGHSSFCKHYRAVSIRA